MEEYPLEKRKDGGDSGAAEGSAVKERAAIFAAAITERGGLSAGKLSDLISIDKPTTKSRA